MPTALRLQKSVCLAFGIIIAFGVMEGAHATPVMTWSAANINSATSVYYDTANPDFAIDYTGATVQLSAAGTHTLYYSNGSGGLTAKPITDDVSAVASLATGELKSKAYLEYGANSGDPMPIGQSNGNSSTFIQLADSFRAYSGTTPYLWNDGTTVHFDFSVTGSESLPPGLQVPTGFDPGQPKNNVGNLLQVAIYQPGALDLIYQLTNFDPSAYPDSDTANAAFVALIDQLNAMYISGDYWYLGDLISPFTATADPNKILAIDPNNPTQISYDFTPGGDFDWVLNLSSDIQLDASLENISALFDFSHTVTTGYVGPSGTTTFSASGLFPGTVALSTLQPSVPEPATLDLLLLGLSGLAVSRKRKT